MGYKKFTDEERAMFSDVERYETIANLWREFSLYLVNIGKKYTNYRRVRLYRGLVFSNLLIKPRRWRVCGSMNSYTAHGGLVLFRRSMWFHGESVSFRKGVLHPFKRKVISLDYTTARSDRWDYPEYHADKLPHVFGMDTDEWDTVEQAISALRSMRGAEESDKQQKREEFRRQVSGPIHKDTRIDLLEIEEGDAK